MRIFHWWKKKEWLMRFLNPLLLCLRFWGALSLIHYQLQENDSPHISLQSCRWKLSQIQSKSALAICVVKGYQSHRGDGERSRLLLLFPLLGNTCFSCSDGRFPHSEQKPWLPAIWVSKFYCFCWKTSALIIAASQLCSTLQIILSFLSQVFWESETVD